MLRQWVLAGCVVVIGLLVGCAHNERSNGDGEPGFRPIFNGRDLTGWMYAKTPEGKEIKEGAGYQVRSADGVIYSTASDGGRLFTAKEYGDFALRFAFKLTPNANNGIAIRASSSGNPAYRGMEIQVLDDSGSKYTKLRPTQYHGSIYGMVPAIRGHQKPVGEWNAQEIIARGRHITVILNGATIVEANLDGIKNEHVLAQHPGVKKEKGHIGFLGHGAAVEFRNIRIKER